MGQNNYSKQEKLRKLLTNPKVVSWRTTLNTVEELFARFETELTNYGCSMPRFELLFHIYFSGPLSGIELSKKMKVSRGNISAFVKRLLLDSLISPCEKSSSLSRPKYSLSPSGEVFFEKILKIHLKHIDLLIEPLSPKTQRELKHWVEKSRAKDSTRRTLI